MSSSQCLGPLQCAIVSILASILPLLPLLPLFPAAASAQDSPLIDCYRFNGTVAPKNTKCPNSNACCGPTATCLSNNLCAIPGDGPNLWVRGPCAVKGWDSRCAQICLYNETRGLFPRVTPCDDGSLCCNEDPQCCQNGKGIFLDENGNRASTRATAATTSYPPVKGRPSRFTLTPSTSAASTSASGSSTLSASTTGSEPAAVTSSVPNSGSDDSIGLKVGLGLGIPLAVIITACVVYFILRRRGRGAQDGAPPVPYPLEVTHSAGAHPTGYRPGTVPKPTDYFRPPPVEIMGQAASELDSSSHPQVPPMRYELR